MPTLKEDKARAAEILATKTIPATDDMQEFCPQRVLAWKVANATVARDGGRRRTRAIWKYVIGLIIERQAELET